MLFRKGGLFLHVFALGLLAVRSAAQAGSLYSKKQPSKPEGLPSVLETLWPETSWVFRAKGLGGT